MTIQQILLKYWGYNKFRPLQEDIINSVLAGNDTLALLPTGGGKSICYQVPALAKDGICIVISPLIALMKDQVENLKKRGIKAIAAYSGMSKHEMDIALDNAAYGDVKLLYVSPERLKTELFIERLKKMKVNLLAVDEAHCISQWGYDFRPPYLQIAAIRQYIPGVPVLALTATATTDVVDDIQYKLDFKGQNVFSKSFERKNLTYLAYYEENKNERLLDIAKNTAGTGVVYVRNRRKTREISDYLNRNGISTEYYHAGLDPSVRDARQNAWMSGKKRIMVSTNAFGMGIDKPDVRFVVHLDLPDSLEAYFQEAGRAGRDEKDARAYILWENSDIIELKSYFESSFPVVETIRAVYKALGNYYNIAINSGRDASFEFVIFDFCDQYRFQPVVVYNSLKFLEKEGYIILSEALMSPSQIMFLMNQNDLYRFQVEQLKFDSFIKLLLRSYSGLFTGFVKIDENQIAQRAKVKLDEVVKMLNVLKRLEVIEYIPRSDKPKIIFNTERIDEKYIVLSPQNYSERKKIAEQKLENVINYVKNETKCRSQFLVSYFGQNESTRCGNCDICNKRNEVDLSQVEFDDINNQLKPMLRSQSYSLEEIFSLVRASSKDKIQSVINWLLDHDKIRYDSDGKISWR